MVSATLFEKKKVVSIWSYDELQGYVDFLREDGFEGDETSLEAEAYSLHEQNRESLFEDLDVFLKGKILCLANLGLWNGRKQGYKLMSNNLSDILLSHFDGNVEVYSSGLDICATEGHHDGTNYYLYREIKDGVPVARLLEKIYAGVEITRSMLNYYTTSLLPATAKRLDWLTCAKNNKAS